MLIFTEIIKASRIQERLTNCRFAHKFTYIHTSHHIRDFYLTEKYIYIHTYINTCTHTYTLLRTWLVQTCHKNVPRQIILRIIEIFIVAFISLNSNVFFKIIVVILQWNFNGKYNVRLTEGEKNYNSL